MAKKDVDVRFNLIDNFTSSFNKTIGTLTSGTKRAQNAWKSVEKFGEGITGMGTKMTAAVTAPLIGAGSAARKMVLDFENGIAKVSTIADTSVMGLDAIRNSTLKLSNQLGVSATEISEAQYNAISAGAATEKSLDLVATAIKSAKAGFTDTATAVDGLTTVYNSFQGAVEYSTLSDQMLMTQNYGKTTFGELAASIGQVTPVANSLNVSTDELFSSVAILTKNGIATSSAITGLKAAYSNILKPTADAAKVSKQLGLDFSATHLKAVGWTKFMTEIKEKTKGDADAMAKLFGSVEALNSMTVLAGAGLNDYTTCLNQMNLSIGLTQESYEKMLTPTERWNIVLNKVKNAGISIGEFLLPAFEKITDGVENCVDAFNNMDAAQQKQIVKWLAVAAAVGPGIMMLGKFVSTLGSAGVSINRMIGIASRAAGGFEQLHTSIGLAKAVTAAFTSPVAVVMSLLAAFAVVLLSIATHFDVFKAGINSSSPTFESLKKSFSELKETLQPILDPVKEFAPVFANLFGTVIAGACGVAISAFAGLLSGVVTIVSGIIQTIKGITTFLTGVFTGDWETAWKGIVDIFSGIVNTLVGLIQGIVNAIKGVVDGIKGITKLSGGGASSESVVSVPGRAIGDSSWRGGLVQVHERGGEILDLPRGTRIYPHDVSMQMAKSGQGQTVNIPKLADQIIIREEADIDRLGERLARKIQKSARNRGGYSFSGNMA